MGVGLLLICLALVPLTGAVWYSGSQLNEIQRSQTQIEAMDSNARELVNLTILRTRLLDERNWAAAANGIFELGLTPTIAEGFIGVNLETANQNAATGVDELIVALGRDDLAVRVEEIRARNTESLGDIAARYQSAEAELAIEAEMKLDHMLLTAAELRDGEEVIQALRVLEASADARQAAAGQLTQFYSVQFSSGPSLAELTQLIAETDRYAQATGDIRRLSPDSSTTELLEATQSSAAYARLNDAVEKRITNGFQQVPGSSSLDLTQIGELVAQFSDGVEMSDAHLDLVTVSGQELLDASARVQADANTTSQRGILSIIIVAAASLAFALALSAVLGRPMRRLARAAEKLRDGQAVKHLKPAGPSELRAATRAISEASGHLELVERQATALAEGDLTHPALGDTAPGALGESLQSAVQTLRSSLNDSQEFRERLEHEALHDGLTHLPNRRACLIELEASLRRCRNDSETMATMFVDLDGFKETNDIHGHLFGDQVLSVIASRLQQLAEEHGSVVGRFGGDEFLFCVSPAQNEQEVVAFAKVVRGAINQPISVGSNIISVDASIGVAFANASRHLSADDLLWEADLAVYEAKSRGRGRVEVCDDALRARVQAEEAMAGRIRHAIERDEFTLFFQPIVRAADGAVTNMEALVRWLPEDGNMIYPDDFIPIAEGSDLIVALDQWVIRRAMAHLADWIGDSPFADVTVSINVSGRHLAADSFLSNILDPIALEGVDPTRVVIEVTESALLEDRLDAARKLEELRSAGVVVAIDDFGTGYTSLGHLKDLPVDILKIDRSFTDPASGSHSLVKLIVDTGHLLGAVITAEGVETQEQARWLADIGADELQGYLFVRPAPVDTLDLERIRRTATDALRVTTTSLA